VSTHDVPVSVGAYRILQALGEGWAGRVYLATPSEDKPFARRGELVAVKTYKDQALTDPNEIKRIEQREFKIGSTIHHPNVVAIHEYGRDGISPTS
jgi:serine/threonine protein kinase